MAKESEARIRFSVFNEDYKRGIKEINDENRRMKNEFRLTESQMKNNSSETEKLETRIERLGREKENVRRKVQLTEQQLEKAKEVYGENSTEAQSLSDDLVKLQTSEQRLQNAIDDANVQLTNQREEMARAEAEQYAKKIEDAGKAVEDLGRKMQDQGKKISAFGKAWSMRVTAPILGAAAASLKVGMDFEEGMSQVQALTGATGRDLEMLSDQAKEMGSSTRFSATEAADAMGFLGMAGWETNEIMSGLPGVLDLAAASKMDLGRAADVTSNIMSAFNMEAEEAGRVSDLLAHSASNANTTVEQMAEAMKYLAPVANTLGMSIEDATAAVMANSDAGIQGSMAGRTFATSLQRLANPTAAMKNEMKKLNVEFFNADGQLKSLPEIVADLEEAMADYDNQTRAATLSTLFGTEAQKNWAILLEEGSESLAKNSAELRNSEGAASEMAKTMQDNARGALTEFRSAAEGAGIAFSEHMLPAITEVMRHVTELIRQFGELDDETQEQIIKWGLLLAAVGPVAVVLGKVVTVSGVLITKVGGLIKLFGVAKGAGLIAKFATLGAAAGPVALAVGTIGALGATIYYLTRDTEKLNQASFDLVRQMDEEIRATDELIEKFEKLQGQNQLTTKEMLEYMDILSELSQTSSPQRIEELTKRQEELLEKSGFTNKEMEEFLRLNDEIVDKSPATASAISDQGNAYADNLQVLKDLNEEKRIEMMMIAEQELMKALRNERDLLAEQLQLQNDRKKAFEDYQSAHNEYISAQKEANELARRRRDLENEMQDLIYRYGEESEQVRKVWLKIADISDDQLELEKGKLETAKENLDTAKETLNTKEEDLDKVNEQLKKIDDLKYEYESLWIAHLDINAEKGQSLKAIDEEIEKQKELKRNMEENTAEALKNTEEYRYAKKEIDNQINRLKDAKGQLQQINDLAAETAYEKNIDINTRPSISELNRQIADTVFKRVDVRMNTPQMLAYADGTSYHKGGPALVGEEGPELAKYRNKYELLTFGIRNLKRGTKVYTAKQTEQIFKSGKVPSYADGIGNATLPTNIGESLARNQESIVNNQIVVVVEPSDVNLDNRQVGSMQWKVVKEFIDRDTDTINRFRR